MSQEPDALRRHPAPLQPLEPESGGNRRELTAGETALLLKRRKELSHAQAIQLWGQKRQAGWRVCPPKWTPPDPLAR